MEIAAPFRRWIKVAAFLSFILLCPSVSWATVFNWPLSPAWAATGPASGSSETVDYFAGGTGFGVAVTVANSGVTLNAGYPQVQTESAATFTGGTTSNTIGTLQLFNTSSASTASFTRVTINLNYVGGVTNPTFQLWDVDALAGQFIDTIKSLQATTTTGSIIYPTLTPTATFNQVTGTGASQVITGIGNATNNTNQGTVGVSFTGTVTSISFLWSNADAGLGTQGIGISPITFNTPVGAAFPEVNSSAGALLLCGGMMGIGLVRRRRSAERLQCQAHA